MKSIITVLCFLLIGATSFAQKNTPKDKNQGGSSDTKVSEGASGVKRSIGYRFSAITEDSDPGNGMFRFNNDTISGVSYIFIDSYDLTGADQTKWYSTWDDTTGATGRGRLNLVEKDGKNTVIIDVTGIFVRSAGFWKVPASYVSGALPFEGAVYYYIFERIENKKNKAVNQEIQNTQAEPVAVQPIQVTQPEPVAVQPAPVVQPEPVVVQPAPVAQPEPVAVQPAPVAQPEPVAVQPAPVAQPEPVAVQPAPVAQPEPVVVQPAPVAQPEPVVVQPAPVVQPEPVEVQPAPVAQPEPVAVQPAPVVQPEPVVVQPAPVAQPEPVAVQPAPVAQPEPIVVQPASVAQPEPATVQPAPVVKPEPVAVQPAPVNQPRRVVDKPAVTPRQDINNVTRTQRTQPPQPVQRNPVSQPKQPSYSTQTTPTSQIRRTQQTQQTQQTKPTQQIQQTKPTIQTQPNQPTQQTKQTPQTQQTKPTPQPPQTTPATQTPAYQGNNLPVDQYSYGSSGRHRKWYSGIIEVGYGLGAGDYGISNFRFNFINGFHLGPNFTIGIGIGYRRYFIEQENYTDRKLVSGKVQIPVFLDFRKVFSSKRITPYMALGLGNSARYGAAETINEGMFVNPSAGIWFNISPRFAFFSGVAYEMQKMEYLNIADDSHYIKNTGSVSLNIGISF